MNVCRQSLKCSVLLISNEYRIMAIPLTASTMNLISVLADDHCACQSRSSPARLLQPIVGPNAFAARNVGAIQMVMVRPPAFLHPLPLLWFLGSL